MDGRLGDSRPVAPADLVVDPGLQPRLGGVDLEHVAALVENVAAWPPLTVVVREGRDWLVDGFHRLAGAVELGLTAVQVTVVECPADGDLRALAFQLNARHGRPLTLADRKTEALRILQLAPERSSRSVARTCGLSHVTVERLRAHAERSGQVDHSDTRQGEGGYTYRAPIRKPGELAPEGVGETIGRGIASLVSGREAGEQRGAVSYLKRVTGALEDQFRLADPSPEALAAAARARLGEEAGSLADRLGSCAFNLLRAARLLGYDSEDD